MRITKQINKDLKLLTPSDLAKILAEIHPMRILNARRVNRTLIDMKFQFAVKNPKPESSRYLPTDAGEEFSYLTKVSVDYGTRTMGYLLWYPSVIPEINQFYS